MPETATIIDPNGNEWEFPRGDIDDLGFTEGQRLTKAQMDDLLHHIMAEVEVSLTIRPAQPN